MSIHSLHASAVMSPHAVSVAFALMVKYFPPPSFSVAFKLENMVVGTQNLWEGDKMAIFLFQ